MSRSRSDRYRVVYTAIKVQGRVVNLKEDGMGVRFTRDYGDALERLERLPVT